MILDLYFSLYQTSSSLLIVNFYIYIYKDPINVDGEWNKFLGQLDYGFTFIFAIEVLLKVQ